MALKKLHYGSVFLTNAYILVFSSMNMHFLRSQEAEAILEDIRPSPWQLLGYGTVSVNCPVTYDILVGFLVC
jgi:hypothetical protein